MKNLTILTSITIIAFGFTTHNKNEFFLFEQKYIHEIPAIESEFNSIQEETMEGNVSKDFFPNAEKYKLRKATFIREKENFYPNPVVEYFYTEEDSIIRLVIYDWDKTMLIDNFFELTKELKNEKDRLKEYEEKYDQLAKQLAKLCGKPINGSGKSEKVTTDRSEYWNRDQKWKKGNCTIELNMIFSIKSNDIGTYRIRAKTYWD